MEINSLSSLIAKEQGTVCLLPLKSSCSSQDARPSPVCNLVKCCPMKPTDDGFFFKVFIFNQDSTPQKL